MNSYNRHAQINLMKWKRQIRKQSCIIQRKTQVIQGKINQMLPEKYHLLMTDAIKNMTRVIIVGTHSISGASYQNLTLQERDILLKEKTKRYIQIAMLEGAGTGIGGIALGLVDFPLLLSIKMKFLFETAAIYGFDMIDYKERLYSLHIFQLAFSSQSKSEEVLCKLENWDQYAKTLPSDMGEFDWRNFQQQYRDYMDIAKILQLLPGIGAVAGAYVNHKLMNKLAHTAMYAYHMRLLKNGHIAFGG